MSQYVVLGLICKVIWVVQWRGIKILESVLSFILGPNTN